MAIIRAQQQTYILRLPVEDRDELVGEEVDLL